MFIFTHSRFIRELPTLDIKSDVLHYNITKGFLDLRKISTLETLQARRSDLKCTEMCPNHKQDKYFFAGRKSFIKQINFKTLHDSLKCWSGILYNLTNYVYGEIYKVLMLSDIYCIN